MASARARGGRCWTESIGWRLIDSGDLVDISFAIVYFSFDDDHVITTVQLMIRRVWWRAVGRLRQLLLNDQIDVTHADCASPYVQAFAMMECSENKVWTLRPPSDISFILSNEQDEPRLSAGIFLMAFF